MHFELNAFVFLEILWPLNPGGPYMDLQNDISKSKKKTYLVADF